MNETFGLNIVFNAQGIMRRIWFCLRLKIIQAIPLMIEQLLNDMIATHPTHIYHISIMCRFR